MYGFQQFEEQYPGSNVLLVTVTDDESRRIEQQSDNQTKAEAVEVLRKMFPGKDVPDATDILVPRWWSNRFFKGTFSNWPIGVNRYEYDLIRVQSKLYSENLIQPEQMAIKVVDKYLLELMQGQIIFGTLFLIHVLLHWFSQN